MTLQYGLSAVAIALTFIAFVPYIRSVLSGETKPHVFSWIVWAAVTLVVFLAQIAGGGGAGAWPIGLSGLLTLYVAWLAYRRRGEIAITRTDWFFLGLSLSSLPLWWLTHDPFWAVVVLTFADTLGFVPTFRKAHIEPYGESISIYAITAVRNVIAIFALEVLSPTTVLFPGTIAFFSVLFVVMVLTRRRAVRKP